MSLVVATHNLMHGLRLPALLPLYRGLRAERGLHVLCVQENAANGERTHAHVIAAALGEGYDCVAEGRLAIVFDRDRVECAESTRVPLPRLDRLSRFERLYIVGGKTERKHAQLAALRRRDGGEPIVVANFHLDTAGTNAHRRRQVVAIADAVRRRTGRVVACGDTNAFHWRRQLRALRSVVAPLADLGARDPDTAPTHFFARADEPTPLHQLGVMLGKLGIDRPGRYDVVCTNAPTAARGQITTPDSDHDLVWAALV